MKKYNIVQKNNKNIVLCSCLSLEQAKKQLDEMIKTDKSLQKYYNWKNLPDYEIIMSIEKVNTKKHIFKVNYKKYILFYEPEQKAKIDYMNDWKNTIKRLQWLIKNDKITERNNVETSYVASAIDNYNFHIIHLAENQFLIQNGYSWKL